MKADDSGDAIAVAIAVACSLHEQRGGGAAGRVRRHEAVGTRVEENQSAALRIRQAVTRSRWRDSRLAGDENVEMVGRQATARLCGGCAAGLGRLVYWLEVEAICGDPKGRNGTGSTAVTSSSNRHASGWSHFAHKAEWRTGFLL